MHLISRDLCSQEALDNVTYNMQYVLKFPKGRSLHCSKLADTCLMHCVTSRGCTPCLRPVSDTLG